MKNKTALQHKKTTQAKRYERFRVDLSTPMIFCVAEATLLLLMSFMILIIGDIVTKTAYTSIALAFLVFYILSAGVICLIFTVKAKKTNKAKLEAKQVETEIYDMFRYIIDLPYAIVDRDGKVKIMNGALQDILGYKNAVSGIDFSEFCSIPIKTLASALKNREDYQNEIIYDLPKDVSGAETIITRLSDGRRYEVIPYVFKIRSENYYFTVFRDTEDLLALAEREERESTVVAYILLDNLQELTQYVRADYRSASTEVENILKSWVAENNGFIREYENDKYVAVFSKQALDKQMQNDFDIQHQIMSLKIGDNSFPVTVSMGIAAISGSLRQKEKAAFDALDIAIKRGGNQVAIKLEGKTGYLFYGGTHKTIENNTAIVSRVSGEILADRIRSASEVLIMGHANPDFDSVGSCVGMARFATEVINEEHGHQAPEKRPKVNIVINKSNETFKLCFEQLASLDTYRDVFISKEDAIDLITSNTVLIICDVNNSKIYEAPELAETVSNIAIIDHHRLASALTFDPFLQFVETTKSSASEIVAEILLRSKYHEALHKEEAEILLSGIMLDTKNFTRNAGAQTFEITHYLYTCGAHTGVVREFFNESLEELMLTGEFESKARIYRDCVAITWMALDRPATPEDRVIAAKVADNLLRIKSVEASFALIQMDGDVVVSGRSKGEINVQLILERLKGGGHFDIAGAQVKNASLERTGDMLKDAIDDYFEYDHKFRKN